MNMYSIKIALADALCVKESSPIMEELFSRYVNPSELLVASIEELCTIKGLGPVKAKQIVSTLHLARTFNTPKQVGYVIKSPKDAFDLMKNDIGHLLHEEFWLLCLNSKNHVISKTRISVGTLNAAIVHPREVFRVAITRAACSIIAIHNHPSGISESSVEDNLLTKRLVEAGEIIGIELLDHVIVTSDYYYSLKENGLM